MATKAQRKEDVAPFAEGQQVTLTDGTHAKIVKVSVDADGACAYDVVYAATKTVGDIDING